MKVGDKLPIDIQGITVGYAEVKGMDLKASEVVLEVPGLYVTMGLATSLTNGPSGDENTDRKLEVAKPGDLETGTLDPEVKAESEPSKDAPEPKTDEVKTEESSAEAGTETKE